MNIQWITVSILFLFTTEVFSNFRVFSIPGLIYNIILTMQLILSIYFMKKMFFNKESYGKRTTNIIVSFFVFFVLLRSLVLPADVIMKGKKENMQFSENGFIVYSEDYNIGLFGIEKLHPFDSSKYRKIYRSLLKSGIVKKDDFTIPSLPQETELLGVHGKEYLKSLNSPFVVSRIVEISSIASFPSSVIRKHIVYPQQLASGGTMLAGQIAIKKGFSVNLSGGYHHAHKEKGSGFCLFADIALSLKKLFDEDEIQNALIIDLDVHHGDGNAEIFQNDPRVDILDIYQKSNFPSKKFKVDFGGGLTGVVSGDTYIFNLKKYLDQIDFQKYDIIFFNAGMDVLSSDSLGGFSLTIDDVVKRDKMVAAKAIDNNIPLVMVLSGGYSKESWKAHFKSIKNIIEMYRNTDKK